MTLMWPYRVLQDNWSGWSLIECLCTVADFCLSGATALAVILSWDASLLQHQFIEQLWLIYKAMVCMGRAIAETSMPAHINQDEADSIGNV